MDSGQPGQILISRDILTEIEKNTALRERLDKNGYKFNEYTIYDKHNNKIVLFNIFNQNIGKNESPRNTEQSVIKGSRVYWTAE